MAILLKFFFSFWILDVSCSISEFNAGLSHFYDKEPRSNGAPRTFCSDFHAETDYDRRIFMNIESCKMQRPLDRNSCIQSNGILRCSSAISQRINSTNNVLGGFGRALGQLRSKVAAGVLSGTIQAGLFHPWDRALYLSQTNNRCLICEPSPVVSAGRHSSPRQHPTSPCSRSAQALRVSHRPPQPPPPPPPRGYRPPTCRPERGRPARTNGTGPPSRPRL